MLGLALSAKRAAWSGGLRFSVACGILVSRPGVTLQARLGASVFLGLASFALFFSLLPLFHFAASFFKGVLILSHATPCWLEIATQRPRAPRARPLVAQYKG